MKRWQKEIRDKYGYNISYSLERSPLRVKVLLHFFNESTKLTLSDISKGTLIEYSNIKGIITGEGGKYNKDRSFTGLGLIICEKGPGGTNLYSLSQKGHNIGEILKENYPTSVDHKVACEIDKVGVENCD